MADNDNYDDEYQFADPDAAGTDSNDYNLETSDSTPVSEKPASAKSFIGNSSVIRNALIVVGVVIIAMVIYPFVHSSFSSSKSEPPVKQTVATAAPIAPVTVIETMPAEPSPSVSMDNQINHKLSSLETSQERMQTEYLSTNSQLNNMNSNINNIMTKMAELNNTITLYAAKIEEQSRVIEQLTKQATARKQAVRRTTSYKRSYPSLKYFLQAVIPGRAWLIATNGTTLTVREGTLIAGLGMVTLIDPRQGRVLTSSGQVIRFSQEDS